MKYIGWAIGTLLIIFLIIFLVGQAPKIRRTFERVANNPQPTSIKEVETKVADVREVYQSKNIKFSFSSNWKTQTLQNIYPRLEIVKLGIPEAIDDLLAVYPADYQINVPVDHSVLVCGQNQVWKWYDSGENFYSINYYLPGQKYKIKILATLKNSDKQIEKEMDNLIASLEIL